MLGPRQLAHFCMLTFASFYVGAPANLHCLLELVILFLSVVAPPTCTFLYADFSPASVSGPTQLALSVEIGDPISLCWGPANLHCLLELVILISLCCGPSMKKLVIAYFHLVNYYQYSTRTGNDNLILYTLIV